MKYMGLGMLLICSFIVIYMWAKSAQTTVEESKPALDYANQLNGKDANGNKAEDSIAYLPHDEGGKFRYLIVDKLAADGPMAKFYGLQRNDCIVEADNFAFRDSDADMAQRMVLSAYTKHQPIKIIRDGQNMTLPLPAAPEPPPATGDGAPKPAGSALQRQLDGITGGGR